MEEVLAGIYAQALGVEGVGVDYSSFPLGGDLLSARRVIAPINATLDPGRLHRQRAQSENGR